MNENWRQMRQIGGFKVKLSAGNQGAYAYTTNYPITCAIPDHKQINEGVKSFFDQISFFQMDSQKDEYRNRSLAERL